MAPAGVMRPMLLPPVKEHTVRVPIAAWPVGDGVVLDFGQNLAGVLRIDLPGNLKSSQEIVLTHSEELDEDGELYTKTLRAADARDVYVASGDERDLPVWQPEFTYHGFRYAKVVGLGRAFRRGEARPGGGTAHRSRNALLLPVRKRAGHAHPRNLRGDRAWQHALHPHRLSSAQRAHGLDERLPPCAFEETPYNFDIGRMFPKLIRDLMDEQGADGAITCTAPFAYGSRPADPVCSSFLVAGLGSALHKGDLDIVAEAYDRFAQWEDCLLAHQREFHRKLQLLWRLGGPAVRLRVHRQASPRRALHRDPRRVHVERFIPTTTACCSPGSRTGWANPRTRAGT